MRISAGANRRQQPSMQKELAASLNKLADRVLKGEHVDDVAADATPATAASTADVAEGDGKPKAAASGDNSVKVATDRLDSLILASLIAYWVLWWGGVR